VKKYTRTGFFSFAASFRTSPMVSWPVSARGGRREKRRRIKARIFRPGMLHGIRKRWSPQTGAGAPEGPRKNY